MSKAVKNYLNDFHIGTYFLQENARTEQHIKDMSECGIDLVFCMDNDRGALDLFQKHGISAVVSGVVPGWFGGDGQNAGTMRKTNKKEDYHKGLAEFKDHPAIIGIDAGDEPSSLDFPYYDEVLQIIKTALPEKLPYLNIFPSYGMLAVNSAEQTKKELGKNSYEEYIKDYCETVHLPYLSFDHYVYSSNKELLLRDLSVTASYCKEYGKKLLVVMQVNSREEDVFISEEQLCFQAFCALAFGASAVSWACYSAGWWYNQVLDENGNKTEQYEKLKNVNRKLRAIATEYIKYNWVSTERLASGKPAENGVISSLVSKNDALLGSFKNENGKETFFLSLLDCSKKTENSFSFKINGNKKVYLHSSETEIELLPSADGFYVVAHNGADACFITIE